MTISVLRERLAVCRLDPDAAIPAWATTSGLWSITRTPDELSVTCDESGVPAGVQSEGGWRVLKLHGPFDFTQVGVLLPIVAVLARAEVSVLVTATYDTDYVLVREDRLPTARAALETAGYTLLDA